MRREAILRSAAALLTVRWPLAVPLGARQEETITLGTVGQASANMWPTLIAMQKGFYAAEDIKLDIVYVPSSAALVQQVTAGSLGISISTGLVDPLRAVGMGAPIADRAHRGAGAALRSGRQAEHQEPRRSQGQADLARRRQGHHPHLCRAHAGAARRQAWRFRYGVRRRHRGARLGSAGRRGRRRNPLPAFNFQTMAKGFHSLGLTVDYAKDLPFSGTAVNVAWANANKDALNRLLRAQNKATVWFQDPANREEAVSILKTASRPEQRRYREGLRLLPRRTFLRSDREGLQGKAHARSPRRWRAWATCPARSTSTRSCCPASPRSTD